MSTEKNEATEVLIEENINPLNKFNEEIISLIPHDQNNEYYQGMLTSLDIIQYLLSQNLQEINTSNLCKNKENVKESSFLHSFVNDLKEKIIKIQEKYRQNLSIENFTVNYILNIYEFQQHLNKKLDLSVNSLINQTKLSPGIMNKEELSKLNNTSNITSINLNTQNYNNFNNSSTVNDDEKEKENLNNLNNFYNQNPNVLIQNNLIGEIVQKRSRVKKHSTKSNSNSTDSHNSVNFNNANLNLNNNLNTNHPIEEVIETKEVETIESGINTENFFVFENLNIQNSSFLFYDRLDLDLKTKNELFDREVNLLKSLILINNLHLNTFEKENTNQGGNNQQNQLFKDNYFVSMADGKSKSIANDILLYNKIQTLNLLTMQISNLGRELKELKSSIETKKSEFKKDMNDAHMKVITAFAQEVKSRKAMRGKVINIEKLI